MIKILLIFFFKIIFSQEIDYYSQIQPIFDQNCTNCHGYSGGLSLHSYDQLMSGGNSGDVIIPGDYVNSLLWQEVNSGDMPPGEDLTSSQIELIENWISQGALEEVLDMDVTNYFPESYALYQNYPNPFNPSTYIRYTIKNLENIKIDIFDLNGNHITSLINKILSPGDYLISWDSTDQNGFKVSSGIYIYKLHSNTLNASKKMVLLK